MKVRPTLLFTLLTAVAISCSSPKSSPNRASAVSTATANSSQNAAPATRGSETVPGNPLVGTWKGQVMIDKLPASLTFVFHPDGKMIYDLGPTEGSRADYKIQEYFIDDSSHLRTVYTQEDEPRDEQKFEYKLEGDTLTLTEFDIVIVLTRQKSSP